MQRVPGVHGAQDGQVGIGVEALKEPLALVVQVAGNVESAANEAAALVIEPPGIFAVAVRITAIPLVEKLGRLVAEHADLAGQRQAAPGRLLGQIMARRPSRDRAGWPGAAGG